MILLLAIIGHLVGDYLLQNDWMALNKKQHSFPCIVHCLLWTGAVCAFTMCFKPWVIAVLFLTHFLQDRTNVILWWMTKVNRQPQFASGPCAPWSIIVVDNVWHVVALWVVFHLLQ